jgi:large subunit ribosomal protein L5
MRRRCAQEDHPAMGLGEATQNPGHRLRRREIAAITGRKRWFENEEGVRTSLRAGRWRDGRARRRPHVSSSKYRNVALPRVRDFKGVTDRSFDGRGNYSLGLREQVIFPEINLEKVDKVKGMTIVICTTARTDADGKALLRALGMPFRV